MSISILLIFVLSFVSSAETEIFGLLLKGRYDSHYLYYIIVDDPNRTLTDKSA